MDNMDRIHTPYMKGDMVKSLLSLWKVVAHDMGDRCAVDTTRDIETVTRRVEHEGLSFLTITLPAFGKSFERWIDQGYVDPSDASSFRRNKRLPAFLQGFTGLVFNRGNGALKSHPDTDAILAVRQLTALFGKMYIPATPERTRSAMMGYLRTDDEVSQWEETWPPPAMDMAFSRLSMLLYNRVFDRVNLSVTRGTLVPKHGPGSTADGLLGNEKFHAHWTWRLEEYFSSDIYLLPNQRYYKLLESVDFKDPGSETPVKVISVPKTSKTPRIIAMEPVCMQYAQQAISSALTEAIDADYVLHRFLRFRNQEPNQLLAREGSVSGTLATLDLSEASDRVSNELVRFLTGRWEHLDGAIQASRSTTALVRLGPDEEIVRKLSKFASMGSALTFPIEAMVFLTVVMIGIEKSLGRRLREWDLIQLADQVAVYGDDIIVPVDHVGSVVHALESFGFKVNSSKSFWTGKFRESCGKDYYNGIDVTTVKFRRLYPHDRQDVEEVVSLVSFFNQCKDRHYHNTTTYLRGELKRLLGENYFPRVSRDSEILGEWDDVENDATRMCPKLHRPLAKGWVVKDHIPVNPLDGERALLKFFLKTDENPLDKEHLHRSGRSRAVSIKLVWAAT